MKYTFLEMKNFYASKIGKPSWSAIDTTDQQTSGELLINLILDEIWFHKPWSWNERTQHLTTVAPYTTGTIAGTKGERIITGTSTVWPNHVYGIPLRGQVIYINNHAYKIEDVISATKIILSAPLLETISAGTGYTIYFNKYPIRWDVGAIRDVQHDEDVLWYRPSDILPVDNTSGTPELWSPAGQSEAAFATGAGIFTQNSRTVSVITGLIPAAVHIGMAICLDSLPDIYYVVDYAYSVSPAVATFTLDRPYTGATIASSAFSLNPVGTPLIQVREWPSQEGLIKLTYTRHPNRLRGDNDLSGLPDDAALLRGIELMGTTWETVGERGFVNEVLYKDKKFQDTLKRLGNLTGSQHMRLYSILDIRNHPNRYKGSNPWNMPE